MKVLDISDHTGLMENTTEWAEVWDKDMLEHV
jgi:hypothetical protein